MEEANAYLVEMGFRNLIENIFFSYVFSLRWSQKLKDILCDTKVLLEEDYLSIAHGPSLDGAPGR